MTKIIFGLIIQAAGYGFMNAMSHARSNEELVYFLLGSVTLIGGLIMTLSGMKEYFFGEILEEMEKKRDPGKYKKCPYCAEMIKREAKVCRYCGKDVPATI